MDSEKSDIPPSAPRRSEMVWLTPEEWEAIKKMRRAEEMTVDPVQAAERALAWLPSVGKPPDPFHVGEAIAELAHGLAACERRRRGEF